MIEVKHYISGRVRLKSSNFKSLDNLKALQSYLLKETLSFKANQKCKSITIYFDENLISLNQIISKVKKFFQDNRVIISEPKSNLKRVVKVGFLSSFSLFSFIKSYLFEIKRVSDATMSIINFGKYLRYIF